jgi:hypothetical protein
VTPPANKNRGKKRKAKEDDGKSTKPVSILKNAEPRQLPQVNTGSKDSVFDDELDPDLDIKYAKALKNMFRAAGTAGVWLANNLHHAMK